MKGTMMATIAVLVAVLTAIPLRCSAEERPPPITCPTDEKPPGDAPVVSVPLYYDYPSNKYYLDVSFGTPGQDFSLVLDSMSYYTCLTDSASDKGNVARRFNKKLSSTFSPRDRGIRNSGRVYMTVEFAMQGNDTLKIGSIELTHDAYISDNTTLTTETDNYDGNLGLSPRTDDINSPLLLKMYMNNQIKEPMFTTFFRKTDEDQGDGGVVTFGGIDEENCEKDIHYVETTPGVGYVWKVKLDSFEIGDNSVVVKSSDMDEEGFATLDTTFTSIYGPAPMIENINKLLGVTDNEYKSVPVVDCDTIENMPDVTLVFKDFKVTLTSDDYIYKRIDDGETICETVFYRQKDRLTAPIFIGLSFLKTVCTVFEYTDECNKYKIGFMKPKHN